MYLLTEDIVANAKLSEFFPVGQNTFNDPVDLITFANLEMQSKLVPFVMSARQGYFSALLSKTPKNNLNHYAVPERAIGNAFNDLFWCPNSTQPQTRYPLPRLQIHDVQTISQVGGIPSGFYMQGDEIVLVPIPSGLAGTEVLLFSAAIRPNRLVQSTQVAKITGSSVNGSQTTFTVDTDLTNSTTQTTPLVVGSKVDILSMVSPFKAWTIDTVVQAITSTSITFNTSDVQDESLTTTPQIGDAISLAQTSNVPMLPQELHPILPELVAFRCLKAIKDQAGMSACAQNIKDMMEGAFKLISNRVESEVEVVYDSNSFINLIPFFGSGVMVRQ